MGSGSPLGKGQFLRGCMALKSIVSHGCGVCSKKINSDINATVSCGGNVFPFICLYASCECWLLLVSSAAVTERCALLLVCCAILCPGL